jgi:hypothetical protein
MVHSLLQTKFPSNEVIHYGASGEQVEESMTIVVQSPIKIVAEGLAQLLEQQGYAAFIDMRKDSRVILVDLINVEAPYPKPHPVPTVALIEDNPKKAQALLAQGYVACVDATQSSKVLTKAIAKALKDQTLSARA